MPEGDTLRRTANALDRALAGRVVTGFDSALERVRAAAVRYGVVGRRVLRVESRGKHLLVHLGGELVLHTQLGLHGGWSLRRPFGTAPPRSVRLRTAEVEAACVHAAVVELLRLRELERHPVLARLGPDLLAEAFDAEKARARLRADGSAEIAVALLAQQSLAGIGNIYKCEALHACGVHPRQRVGEIDEATLERLIATARRLMQRSVEAGQSRTMRGLLAPRFAVYGRGGRPCGRCGTTVVRFAQAGRSTWFCPRCQPARDAPPAGSAGR